MNTGVQATSERGQEDPEDNLTGGEPREQFGCHDFASTHRVSSAHDTSSDKPTSVLAVQIRANRERFPGCILLTRVGQFYEVLSSIVRNFYIIDVDVNRLKSYFDQAPEVATLLGIKLTSRPWGGGGRRVHMCGFPLNQLDRHLKTLVQSCNRFVALCEEFPPTRNGEEFTRRVVRIITPGTLIDESFLDTYENNYLLSISCTGNGIFGLAWIDVSAGEFYSQSTTLECLRDEISRIGPREVILAKDIDGGIDPHVRDALANEGAITTTVVDASSLSPDATSLAAPDEQGFDPQDISAPLTYTDEELQAILFLNSVLQSRLLEHMPVLSSPIRQNVGARMQIDSHTIHALEIKEAMREGGARGSLFSTIKRTVTSGGTRLLSRWLCEFRALAIADDRVLLTK